MILTAKTKGGKSVRLNFKDFGDSHDPEFYTSNIFTQDCSINIWSKFPKKNTRVFHGNDLQERMDHDRKCMDDAGIDTSSVRSEDGELILWNRD